MNSVKYPYPQAVAECLQAHDDIQTMIVQNEIGAEQSGRIYREWYPFMQDAFLRASTAALGDGGPFDSPEDRAQAILDLRSVRNTWEERGKVGLRGLEIV